MNSFSSSLIFSNIFYEIFQLELSKRFENQTKVQVILKFPENVLRKHRGSISEGNKESETIYLLRFLSVQTARTFNFFERRAKESGKLHGARKSETGTRSPLFVPELSVLCCFLMRANALFPASKTGICPTTLLHRRGKRGNENGEGSRNNGIVAVTSIRNVNVQVHATRFLSVESRILR